jgi:cytoskeleton protein RodZ
MGQPIRPFSDPGVDPVKSDGLSGYASGSLLRSQGVAELLRESRLQYGLGLATVSDHIRIRQAYLEAIEEGRFADLPGSTYGAGFVRTYADYLGLDSEDVVRRFRQETARAGGPAQLIFPTLRSETTIPGGAIIMLSLLLAGLAYGAWFVFSERDKDHVATVQQVPPQLTAMLTDKGGPAPAVGGTTGVAFAPPRVAMPAPAPAPVQAAAPPPPPPPLPDEVTLSPAPVVVSQNGAVLAMPPAKPAVPKPPVQVAVAPPAAAPAAPSLNPLYTQEPQPTPSATTAQAATPPVGAPPADVATARVVLQARLESWVQIVGPDNATLFTKVLRAGEFYPVPAQAGLSLITGNAGGLDIWLDGRKLMPMGPIGVVRRSITLDPAKLREAIATGQ